MFLAFSKTHGTGILNSHQSLDFVDLERRPILVKECAVIGRGLSTLFFCYQPARDSQNSKALSFDIARALFRNLMSFLYFFGILYPLILFLTTESSHFKQLSSKTHLLIIDV